MKLFVIIEDMVNNAFHQQQMASTAQQNPISVATGWSVKLGKLSHNVTVTNVHPCIYSVIVTWSGLHNNRIVMGYELSACVFNYQIGPVWSGLVQVNVTTCTVNFPVAKYCFIGGHFVFGLSLHTITTYTHTETYIYMHSIVVIIKIILCVKFR